MSIRSNGQRNVYKAVRWVVIVAAAAFVCLGLVVAAKLIFPLSTIGKVQDEAMRAGRTADSLRGADEDYFHDMDGGIKLTRDEIIGRNNWIVWTGGNDRFWDAISPKSVGILDLLKVISDYPALPAKRSNRWDYLGLVNEPCFAQASGPDPNRWGLWLDKRGTDCPPDPFENADKYPGVKIGARGKTVEVGSYYGYPTGIVGLRLFPNPNFDEKARRHWDPVRYYTDPTYYNDAKLVKPYRVGMSCGFCHVGPNPLKPPADPNNPKWENLSSMVGAQYFWIDRIFNWNGDQKLYFYQLFHTSRPGSLDTSLVSTDNINNPRTMNAVYDLNARLAMAFRWGKERIAGGQLNNKQFNDYPSASDLYQFFTPPETVFTARVLKDGSDSVGTLGALNRVYINIGLFSEEWLQHFNPLIGGKKITPMPIATLEKNSAYWRATEDQTVDLARFMLVSTDPQRLSDAPGGKTYLTADRTQLTRGKIIFAERCARCHSSKLPQLPPQDDLAGCAGSNYMACFVRYFRYSQTDQFKSEMQKIVLSPDFLDKNYLSTDARIPVTLLGTNAASPLATNAIGGNIWDNFSSQSYKELPSVGVIRYSDALTGKLVDYKMPAGGRGYTRVPSLISVWSTAPFLLNNSVGTFNPSPSVEARMDSFNNSIHQMLWPETRAKDSDQAASLPPGVHYLPTTPWPSHIDRTTRQSSITVAYGYLPWILRSASGLEQALLPWLFDKNGVRIGPFPAGMPVGLVSNIDLLGDSDSNWARVKRLAYVAWLMLGYQHKVGNLGSTPDNAQLQAAFDRIAPRLEALSKCPDYVVNKGHYFGTPFFNELLRTPALQDSGIQQEPPLSDADKQALIEFLKTF